MSDTLELAGELRARDDSSLRSLLRRRNVAPDAPLEDFFDLAEVLLVAKNVRLAVEKRDRRSLAVILLANEAPGSPDDIAKRLEAAQPALASGIPALITAAQEDALMTSTDAGFRGLDAAAAAVISSVSHTSTAGAAGAASTSAARAALLTTPAPPLASGESTNGATAQSDVGHRANTTAAEHAWNSTVAIAQLILELQTHPARALGNGAVSAPDLKRLALSTRLESDRVAVYLEIAACTGLINISGSTWIPTPRADDWLSTSGHDRWITLVSRWFTSVPVQLRALIAENPAIGWDGDLSTYAAWYYPAGQQWITQAVDSLRRTASALGLATLSSLTPSGYRLFVGPLDGAGGEYASDHPATARARSAAEPLSSHFPHEVQNVYLQHDLTVIAPGPLAPARDLTLRTMAVSESRAQASSYRFTPESVNRALAGGATAESMLGFLSEISLTGIPQPVDYLVRQSAERYGAVRVGSLAPTDDRPSTELPSRSYVRSNDEGLIAQLAIDQSITAIGLVPVSPVLLHSRFDFHTVFWALSDAKYPVAAEDSAGAAITLHRQPPSPAAQTSAEVDHSELIARLRANDEAISTGGGQAWMTRQLEAAIRAKATVVAVVDVPGASPVTLTLEPTGVGGGRLRARDRAADIERTLPLTSIVELRA